ncbi:MAG: sugar ABC transporter permease [Clostridiales bacterium]|nr:sugar ABC transporter permease [Clostridiales bacterium]
MVEAPTTIPTNYKKPRKYKIRGNLDLLLFCLPGIVITFIYHYIPIYGVQIAFRSYSARRGIWGSRWVGLDNFQRFFSSANAWPVIRNTLILSVYSIAASFPIAIILALLLNSFRHPRYRKAIQSITYAPHFISTVVMCGMLILFLSPRVGVVNTVIRSLGGEPINFMGRAAYWRHIYVWSGVWQSMGWNSIIYFAALSGVSPEFHEAAIVDGATKLQRIRFIDLPFLMPVASMLLILNFGSVLSIGFEKAYALQNDLNLEVSEIISTYVYKVGILQRDQSFSTAIGLFNSLVNATLLISVNWITGKLSENSLW